MKALLKSKVYKISEKPKLMNLYIRIRKLYEKCINFSPNFQQEEKI